MATILLNTKPKIQKVEGRWYVVMHNFCTMKKRIAAQEWCDWMNSPIKAILTKP